MITVEGLEKLGILKRNFVEVDASDSTAVAVAKAAYTIERGGKKAITTGATRAIKTGALRSSISTTSLTRKSATIGPVMNYGIFVHEGTKFMRARPFMSAGLGMEAGALNKIMKDTGLQITRQLVKGL